MESALNSDQPLGDRGHHSHLIEPSNLSLKAQTEFDKQHLQELLQQAPAGIGLLTGPHHVWTYVNDYYVRMTGRSTPADFIGRTIGESLPEIDHTVFIGLLDRVYRTGEPISGSEAKVILNRGPGGSPDVAWFDFIYQPVRTAERAIEGIFVHAIDVTDKVLARRLVEENAERLNLAQSAANIGTWEWDPDKNTQLLSPELHRIFGTTPDDPNHAQVWASRVDPRDLSKVFEHMRLGYQTGALELEYRYIHPDTGLRWIFCKGRKFQGETRMLGVVQDVTESKSVEQAPQRLAAIVASTDDAIISKDLDGIITSWNPAAERLFGFTASEMIGQPILKIIPPELHSDEDRILATIARGQRIEHYETVRLRRDGQRVEVSLTVSPVKDDSGKIVGAAKIARDITQRNKAERALRTNEMLASVGRLAATVAHEINNPLEAVTNLIYLARRASSLEDAQSYLATAEEELDRVSYLTRQTLGFYRETKGASAFKLGAMVTSLLPIFASRARARSIRLCPEIRDDFQFMAVAGEIRQVIANLVSNAIDAAPNGSSVIIRIAAATEHSGSAREGVRISVADSGTGIPASLRSQLFQPFFTTKKEVGTGLGLWICKSIVENHHGSIQLRSRTKPGSSGTVFSVFLPLQTQSNSSAAPSNGSKEKELLPAPVQSL